MHCRSIFLALVFSVIVFGVSGSLPTASAAQIQLNQASCEDPLFLQGTWSVDTCTISVEIIIGVEEDPDSPDPVLDQTILIIPAPTTLVITDVGGITLIGGIESLGLIDNSGIIDIFDGAEVLSNGEFVNQVTGDVLVTGDFNGNGNISNFGTITFEGEAAPDGTFENSGFVSIDGGSLTVTNTFTNNVGGVVENGGSAGFGNFVNDGTVNNISGGFMDISGFQNNIAVFTNNIGSSFVNSGGITVDPSAEINNIEGFAGSSSGSTIDLGGIFRNHNTFENVGAFNILFSGQVINLGTFTNSGVVALTSTPTEIASFDGTSGTIFQNNNIILNQCGEILGPFGGTDPVDQCDFTLTITSPSEGQVVSDVTPTTFSGIANDRDAFGTPIDSGANIQWTSSKDGPLGTGSSFNFQLITLGNHLITASVLDPNSIEITATVNILVSQIDKDGDTFPVQNDCDDNDPLVNPGQVEIFGNGIDDNCDGNQDEGFTDVDLDTFPSSNDCDDNNATVFPGAPELVDGLDNNCDTILLDEEIDNDGDLHIPGFFDSLIWVGDASVIGGGDCDDFNPARFLGNTEIIDGIANDCVDGIPDNETDDDSDGFIEAIFDINIWIGDVNVVGGLDCDDAEPLSNPGLTEIDGDGIDNDCDGTVDSLGDFDGDGFFGGVDDCNDADATVFPGAPELVDGLDNDCDGFLLESEIDNDGDGFIDGTFDAGGFDGTLQVLGDKDCNDTPITGLTIFPGAPELLDGIDNDCDGVIPLNEIDEDSDGSTADLDCDDNDPARSPNFVEIVDGIDNDCVDGIPDNEVDNDTDFYIDGMFDVSLVDFQKNSPLVIGDNDCNDADATINPGATEIPDGIDNNCDTILLDEEIDNDGDGQAEFEGDCDDNNEFNFSGNTEIDDGIDNNCDGVVDEGFDVDADGFSAIFQGDCNDNNPIVFPGALEIPDGLDNDCNTFIDDLSDKFTTPELQENLDDKTIRDFEKTIRKISHENEKLEKKNISLDKKAVKFDDRAERAADKGKIERAEKFQAKADNIRAKIASNESLIEINDMQILVIKMSLGTIPVDLSQTIIIEYDNLTPKAFENILDDIEDNLEEIEELEEKAVKADKKADKYDAKGKPEKAEKSRLKAIQIREEIEIIVDLNDILICAIDFTPDLLENDHDNNHDD